MGDWIILRTASSRTLQLAASLNEAGFEAWTPVEVRDRLAARTRKPVEQSIAITPSFVFAPSDRLRELLALSRSPNLTCQVWDAKLRRMVSKGHPHFTVFHLHGRCPTITETSLAPLHELESKLATILSARRERAKRKGEPPRFKAGDRVRISEGAFGGLDLEVVEANTGKMVLVTYQGWVNPIEISAWTLRDVQVSVGTTEQAALAA